MHNRNIDYEALKMENFQLKNEITDLKNGFDLNRDVLKILEDQTKQSNPKYHIFYQIISRLTGINNSVMIANMNLVQQKNHLITDKKKMQATIDRLNQRIFELIEAKNASTNQIIFQMRLEIKSLHAEILALNEECLRKNIQISNLQQEIAREESAELKKPMIPTIKQQLKLKPKYGENLRLALSGGHTERSMINQIPIRNEGNQILRQKIVNKSLKQQNRKLKKLIEQLEFRLTLLTSIYKIEPQDEGMRECERDKYQQERKLDEGQLSLLLFALKNTQLEQDEDTETIKLTITKRCQAYLNQQCHSERTKSCPKLNLK